LLKNCVKFISKGGVKFLAKKNWGGGVSSSTSLVFPGKKKNNPYFLATCY